MDMLLGLQPIHKIVGAAFFVLSANVNDIMRTYFYDFVHRRRIGVRSRYGLLVGNLPKYYCTKQQMSVHGIGHVDLRKTTIFNLGKVLEGHKKSLDPRSAWHHQRKKVKSSCFFTSFLLFFCNLIAGRKK